MDLGGLIDHLIHRQADEVAEHDVDDGSHSGHCGADGDASKARFGDRRVDHTVRSELIHQSGENFEWMAGFGNVFTADENLRIAAHFLGESFADGFGQCDFTCCSCSFRHKRPGPPCRDAG